ncbi:MAG TPA: discoidin domain-containing protein [Verrucomicrobiae bacterium]
MSEFKYACPVCGQHIKCDSSQAGTVMTCPTCFQQITVPNAPATEEQKFIITGTKVGNERPMPKLPEAPPAAAPRASGFPGMIVVIIILLFIAVVVSMIYYNTVYKMNLRYHERQAQEATNAPPIIVWNPPSGSIDLALHKVAFASSQQSKNPASNGNDGNLHTRWGALNKSVNQWWTVDLNNLDTITNAQIAWEHDAAYEYVIETSLDNSNWTVAVNQSANVTASRMTSDDFSGHGRFLRVVVTGLPVGSRASFYEFSAFGSTNDLSLTNNSGSTNGN